MVTRACLPLFFHTSTAGSEATTTTVSVLHPIHNSCLFLSKHNHPLNLSIQIVILVVVCLVLILITLGVVYAVYRSQYGAFCCISLVSRA